MAIRNQAQNSQVGYYDSAAVTPRTKQVRRINNDFEYIKSSELPAHATNDEQFNAAYQEQGLRSKSRSAERQRKLQEEEAANDASYEEELAAQDLEDEEGHHQNKLVAAASANAKKKILGKLLGRTRATAVNASIFAWGGTLWLTVQLPCAIISIAMIGVVAAVSSAMQATGFVGSTIAWVATKAADAINLAFGIDLASAGEGLLGAFYTAALVSGLFTILGASFQYTVSLLRPFSGQGSGLKMGLFLLALLGYAMPVANIFPWALPWMIAVWKYPR